MALHEHFREYTAEEILQIKREVCIAHKCPYLSRMTDSESATFAHNNFCSYLEWAGKMRGCMPDECTHYMDERPKHKGKFFNLDEGYNQF